MDKGDRSCQCGVDCDEIGYETKISASVWPSPKYEVNIRILARKCFIINA